MEAPAEGLVMTVVNDREFPLSYAEYWTDGEGFVVRSREFDCLAEGDDLQKALSAFGQAVYDYADTLQQREASGATTESEQETFKRLSERLSRIYLEQRRSQTHRRGLFRRRSNDRTERRSWKPAVPA